MIDLKKICNDTVNAVKETEIFILKESGIFDKSRAVSKGLHDFVSYVDKKSEEMLVEKLGKVLPEAGFIAEEGTSTRKGKRYNWIIDPLDGTTNFIHGLHPYAISVALSDGTEPVAGVVCNVGENEIFFSWKDGGAWLNDKPIYGSEASELSECLIATGLPYSNFGRLESYMNCLTHFCRVTHGIRRLGSASVDLAYVACGRYEAFFEYDLKVWDIAAGMLLVREAGGRVSDFSGNEQNLTGNEIVASCGPVFPEFLKNVSKFMVE